MSKLYFISDAHLGLSNKTVEARKEQLLLEFLDHASKDAFAIFILGDLFDTWFEYKTVIPRGYHRIISALDELVRKGVKLHYLAGNHDFWMDNFFSDEIGINVHFNEYTFLHEGKKFYLHHGDGFSEKDVGYKILKKVLRNKINIRLYKILHPDIGISLAKKISRLSRKHSSNKYIGNDELILIAKKIIEDGYDIVIMGHQHNPKIEKIENGIYVNLGDWITHFTYAEMQDGEILLKNWLNKNGGNNG